MLTEKEFDQQCIQSGISDKARSLLTKIRTSEPARGVGNGPGFNVTGRFPSQKMKRTIQYDSHRVEMCQVYELEHDNDVLEYYDQPLETMLRYVSKNGRLTSVKCTPDFFVIRKDSATFVECKPEKELINLHEKSPNIWQMNNGVWRSPPREAFASQYGLGFKIYSSKDINWFWQRNIQYLEDYIRSNDFQVVDIAKRKILDLVKKSPSITVYDMVYKHGVLADDIYKLALSNEIYIDLYTQVLPEPQTVSVFINKEIAHAYSAMNVNSNFNYINNFASFTPMSEVTWNGVAWTIISIGNDKVTLLNQESKSINLSFDLFNRLIETKEVQTTHTDFYNNRWMIEKLNKASKSDLQEALKRAEYVRQSLNGVKTIDLPVPERTFRYWKKNYNEAERLCGHGFLGLIPKNSHKGNRDVKITTEMSDLLEEIIENNFETVANQGITVIFGKVRNAFKEKGWDPVSRRTVSDRVKKRSGYAQTKKISGRKAAYQQKEFYWLGDKVPVHGDAPFQIAHLDHTELEMSLIHSRNFKNLKRPYGTLLMDAYSRRILAIYISFEKPSYRSDMMVLRECVRRYHRLPRTIVVDRGKDFQSEYFDTLLAVFEVNKKTRPTSAPRFGSVGERIFETMNTQFIHNLKGNTKITRINPRQMTKEVNPENHAIWNIQDFYDALCKWAYEVYDTQVHSSLGQSPRAQYDQGVREGGLRDSTFIPYDDSFKFLTMPTTSKGFVTIDCQRGIKVNYFNYWNPKLNDRELAKKKVDVRYDPFNMASVFVYVNCEWLECFSPYGAKLYGRTEQEVEHAVKELKKLKQQNGEDYKITAERLAQFLVETETTEYLLEDRLKAQENTAIVHKINGPKTEQSETNQIHHVSLEVNLDDLITLEVT